MANETCQCAGEDCCAVCKDRNATGNLPLPEPEPLAKGFRVWGRYRGTGWVLLRHEVFADEDSAREAANGDDPEELLVLASHLDKKPDGAIATSDRELPSCCTTTASEVLKQCTRELKEATATIELQRDELKQLRKKVQLNACDQCSRASFFSSCPSCKKTLCQDYGPCQCEDFVRQRDESKGECKAWKEIANDKEIERDYAYKTLRQLHRAVRHKVVGAGGEHRELIELRHPERFKD